MARHDELRPVMITICKRADERIRALGLKGKRADDEALAFMCGAAAASEHDQVLYAWMANVISLVLSVRGVFGLRETLATLEKEQRRAEKPSDHQPIL